MGIYSQQELLKFLLSLEANVRESLYSNESVCRAVFRGLPPCGRVFVLRLLAGDVQNFSYEKKQNKEVLNTMSDLNILQKSRSVYRLEENFKNGIRFALCKLNSQIENKDPEVTSADLKSIETFARQQWDQVLLFLVSSSNGNTEPETIAAGKGRRSSQPAAGNKRVKLTTSRSPSPIPTPSNLSFEVEQVLKDLSYVDTSITSSGYEFLLKDVFEEVWILVQHFTSKLQNPALTLRLLFSLSFLKAGSYMSLKQEFTPEDLQLIELSLDFFEKLGMIKRQSQYVIQVSSLGTYAIFPPSSQKKLNTPMSQDNNEQEFQKFGLANIRIVVETTFKVYCYTNPKSDDDDSQEFVFRLLSLFCQVEVRLPNLIVAMITRDSIADAFKKGISDNQIISFLIQNAHPKTRVLKKVVPDNVTDQITLWKKETCRLTTTYGHFVEFQQTSNLPEIFALASEELKKDIVWTDERSKFFVQIEDDQKLKRIFKSLNQQKV